MRVNKNPKTEFLVIDKKVVHSVLMPLIFISRDGSEFIVPREYKTNGASVPRALWSFMNPFGVGFPAAILHDYLVRESRKTLNSDIKFEGKKMKWSKATKYFKEALQDLTPIPNWKINIICKAVNLNGRINHRGNY